MVEKIDDSRCECGKRNKCPLNFGDTKLAFPQKTPINVRRDVAGGEDSKCHLTPILNGVEGFGFDCDGEGPETERAIRQLHFDKE